MGAWIETVKAGQDIENVVSHPTWVRGLKHLQPKFISLLFWSHPTWVRGLKHRKYHKTSLKALVAPYVGAWIET